MSEAGMGESQLLNDAIDSDEFPMEFQIDSETSTAFVEPVTDVGDAFVVELNNDQGCMLRESMVEYLETVPKLILCKCGRSRKVISQR